jgi:serine/threonine-protein kinase
LNKGSKLALAREWIVGDELAAGGFGRVYLVASANDEAVAKLVPKDPGADRELLFVNLDGVRNVVPVIDRGETTNEWVLIMPRAEKSLRQHLDAQAERRLDVEEAVAVLSGVALALSDLDGKVVHRDVKPANTLLLQGRWCLADFGISRYSQATTAPDTRKFALSPQYAAPERWRNERASASTDVYSLGVMAYEMLAGSPPFIGPSTEDYREQHLHSAPSALDALPSALGALIDECLYKAPGARPTPANVLRRLEGIGSTPESAGLARLREADRLEVSRRAEGSRQESETRSAEDTRRELAESADKALTRIGDSLKGAILTAAPSVAHAQTRQGGWRLQLNQASLTLSAVARTLVNPWRWQTPALDVVSAAALNLAIPANQQQYEGRSHSIWFCDAQQAGEYAWYETAFMISPLIARRVLQEPFSLDPGEESAKALWTGMAEYQVAWPFTRLTFAELDEFIDRWAGWFADASHGRLSHPNTMPERAPQGSWRTR